MIGLIPLIASCLGLDYPAGRICILQTHQLINFFPENLPIKHDSIRPSTSLPLTIHFS